VIRELSQKSYAKTETVSFRIDARVRSILEGEARKGGMSLNTLVSQIFLRYAMWGRYADRLRLIPVSKDLLRDLFGSMDREKIAEVARQMADSSGREHILFLYQELNLQTLVQFLNLWSSHFDTYEHRYDGRNHFYTIHHDVNLNFSLFVREYLTTMIQSVATKQVRFETVSPNSVTFRFEGGSELPGTATTLDLPRLEASNY